METAVFDRKVYIKKGEKREGKGVWNLEKRICLPRLSGSLNLRKKCGIQTRKEG